MAVLSLEISALFSLVTAVVYAYLALRLGHRQVSSDAAPANYALVTWWAAIGLSSLITGVDVTLYSANALPVWLYATLTHISLVAITIALAGLAAYLLYLYVGSYRSWWFVAIFYALFYVGIEALVAYGGAPTAIGDNGWTLRAANAQTVTYPPGVVLVFIIGILGPQIAIAVAYLGLYWKVNDRAIRYRVALVSGSIIIWFGASLVVALVELALGQSAPIWQWQVASDIIALGAVCTLFLAYFPPRAWRIRWGLRGADEPAQS
ncbi:MAG: hypothetical protein ACYDDF_05160 [Thermoplasmatota archaeon]